MINKNIFLLAFSLVYVISLSAVQQKIDIVKYPNFAKLIMKYSCSKETQHLVQAYQNDIKSVYEELTNKGCVIPDHMNTFMYKNIPYMKKHFDISRIKNAQRLEKVIKRFGLDRLSVAKKCIIQDHKGWFIVAEKIDSMQLYPFSLSEIEQLVKIVEETGFSDWGSNIVRDQDNNLVFVDTEDISFLKGGGIHENPKADILKCGLFYSYDEMEQEAAQWLQTRIEELGSATFDQILSFDTQYDDLSVNFEKATIEYKLLQKEERFDHVVDQYGKLVAWFDYILDF